jgi:hypothetical protein
VAVALGLLQRGARGQSLSSREQRFLKRTLTDVASVIPIGIVMLLPITAVGHAFFLAMLQKYAPGLVSAVSKFLYLEEYNRFCLRIPLQGRVKIDFVEHRYEHECLDRSFVRLVSQGTSNLLLHLDM